jgi:hypothetical protein
MMMYELIIKLVVIIHKCHLSILTPKPSEPTFLNPRFLSEPEGPAPTMRSRVKKTQIPTTLG